MHGLRLSLAAAALIGGTALAQAASPEPDTREAVRQQLDTALANIQFARCGATAFCAPASQTESVAPPLTIDQASKALDRGALSGIAKVCKLDWIKQSFQPMAAYWRSQGFNDRQMALIGILHGMALARAEATIGSRPCSDKLRHDVEARLPNLP